jgi:hypothetical protein
VYGKNRQSIVSRVITFLCDSVHSVHGDCDIYVNQRYDTGLSDRPIVLENVAFLLHGIVFPWDISIDELSDTYGDYLKMLLNRYKGRYHEIPLGFRNGSYAGIVVDENERVVYAYTSFLNSFPLYYAQIDGCLVISSDYSIVSKATCSSLEHLSVGLFEYYTYGTNLSEFTAVDRIKSIPKGAYLHFHEGQIDIEYYYVMPKEETPRPFEEYVDEFAELWESTIQSVHSEKFKYGIGLTGGIDSRLIYAALRNKSKPLLFTGSHPEHADYMLAKKLTDSEQLNNHVLEDYRTSDKLKGYAEYCCLSDNPLNCNSLNFVDQLYFREKNNLSYELFGLTEFLGGVYHYWDRRSMLHPLKMSMPIKHHSFNSNVMSPNQLITLGLRNSSLKSESSYFDKNIASRLSSIYDDLSVSLRTQIGDVQSVESYLERFRHVHKMANLLTWSILPGRIFNEHVSPSMNIEMTDFACKIPLEFRDSRRILLSYLKRFKPKEAKHVLSGYIFSANSPWIMYKMLSPYIKVLNSMGITVPYLQWYIKRNDYKSISNMSEIYQLQKYVCTESKFLHQNFHHDIMLNLYQDKSKLMRLYNVALLEIQMSHGQDYLKDYLFNIISFIRRDKN